MSTIVPNYNRSSRKRPPTREFEKVVATRAGNLQVSSIQKFGFINGVDNVNWPPYRDSKS